MSDDVMRQIQDDMREERLKAFWIENRAWIVGGIILAIVMTAALSYWRQHTLNRDAQATYELFNAMDAADEAAQVAALDVLDGEEVLAVDAADLVDLGDVDVVELDGDLRLIDEADDEVVVGGELRQDFLDDDKLFEAGDLADLGEKDLAHAAARQALEQEESTKCDGKFRPQKRRSLHMRLRRRHQGLHVTSAPAPCK